MGGATPPLFQWCALGQLYVIFTFTCKQNVLRRAPPPTPQQKKTLPLPVFEPRIPPSSNPCPSHYTDYNAHIHIYRDMSLLAIINAGSTPHTILSLYSLEQLQSYWASQVHIPYVKFVNVMLPISAVFYSSSPSLYKISNWFIFNINYHKLAYISHFQNKMPWVKRFYSIFAQKKTHTYTSTLQFRKNSKLLKMAPHKHTH